MRSIFENILEMNQIVALKKSVFYFCTGRRSREWLQNESEASGGTDHYSHHLTIGPHGGVDWVRRLGLEAGGRKSSDSEISGAGTVGTGDELTLHRSTDCIVSKELASSSDSDLLRYSISIEFYFNFNFEFVRYSISISN